MIGNFNFLLGFVAGVCIIGGLAAKPAVASVIAAQSRTISAAFAQQSVPCGRRWARAGYDRWVVWTSASQALHSPNMLSR